MLDVLKQTNKKLARKLVEIFVLKQTRMQQQELLQSIIKKCPRYLVLQVVALQLWLL